MSGDQATGLDPNRAEGRSSTLRVGITGGIGSGKSAVTDRLQSRGVVVVDADQVARDVVEPGTPALAAIREHFGDSVITADGRLDRPALRKVVFAAPEERRWLESLTHPLIGEQIAARLACAESVYAVLSSPLLIETSQKAMVDLIVVVDVPEAVQLERTMARDANSEELVKSIMAAQASREQRLAAADYIVDNSGTLNQLDRQVADLHEHLVAKAGSPRSWE